jgi:hypothetical protein
MCGTVGIDQVGVMHGKIRCALWKVARGETACLQDRIDEFIGLNDRAPWMVDEVGLYGFPLGHQAGTFRASQFPKLETAYPVNPFAQVSFGFVSRLVFPETVIILRTEPVTETQGSLPAAVDDERNDGDYDKKDNDGANNEQGALVINVQVVEVHGGSPGLRSRER